MNMQHLVLQHVFDRPGSRDDRDGAVVSECDEQGVGYGVQRGRVGRFPWSLMLGALLYVRSHGSYAAGPLVLVCF